MSKANDKRSIEYAIQDAAQWVPKTCRPVYSTMMRQEINGKSPLMFYQISAGCKGHWSTGSAIMRLVGLGYAIESTIETEWGPKRAWRLTTAAEQNAQDRAEKEISKAHVFTNEIQ